MKNKKSKSYIPLIALILLLSLVSVTFISSKYTKVSSTSNIENVLDKDDVTEVSIDIKEEDWDWLIENATEEEYRSGNITINGETFYNVGIRPKGNSSLKTVASDDTTDRFSFKIDFGQYVKDQNYHGIEELALNNIISDATYMKEYLSYDVFKTLGVATPEYSYTNINVNGEEWGLYLGVEVVDERFIEKNYGKVEGNLYKPETMEIGAMNGDKGAMMPGNNNVDGDVPADKKEGGAPNFQKKQGEVNGQQNKAPGGNVPNDKVQGDNMPQDNAPQGDNIPQGNVEPGEQMQGEPNQGGNEGAGNGAGMPTMGRGNSSGANFKYIDDNASSYSVIRDSAVFKKTTDKDFENIVEMIKNLNEGNNIEDYLNVEEVLKYFAGNTFLVNLDSYSGGMYHNYYLYEKDGISEILPWDLNMSFGGFSIKDGSKAINFPIDSPVTGELEDAPLIGKLLEVPKYKEMYHGYLEKLVKEYVNSGEFENSIIELDNLITDYVENDATSFYSFEEYKTSIPELITFGNDRGKSITEQLNGYQPSTEYGTITTDLDISALGGMNSAMGGQGKDGEKPNMEGQPNMEGMPSADKIAEAMKLLNNKNFEELTQEEKDKLSELGVNEEMINKMKNIGRQGAGEMPGGTGIAEGGFTSTINYLIAIGIAIVVLVSTFIFITKYRRKRY